MQGITEDRSLSGRAGGHNRPGHRCGSSAPKRGSGVPDVCRVQRYSDLIWPQVGLFVGVAERQELTSIHAAMYRFPVKNSG